MNSRGRGILSCVFGGIVHHHWILQHAWYLGVLGILMKVRLFMTLMRYGRSDVLRHELDECYERIFQYVIYGHVN